MIQKPIRDYGGVEYTVEEGAELIKELNDRTVSDKVPYNSIEELAARALELTGEFVGVAELKPALKNTSRDVGDVSGIFTVDFSSGIQTKFNLTADATLSFSNLIEGKTITLVITGNHALTLPAGFATTALDDFEGTKINYLQVYCADANTPIFLSGLEARDLPSSIFSPAFAPAFA